MVTVLASIYVVPGEKGKFLDIFKANIPAVCAEAGCVSYVPMVDEDSGLPPQEMNENLVTVVEQWESVEALKKHLAAPHMLKYKGNVKELVEKVTLKVLKNA